MLKTPRPFSFVELTSASSESMTSSIRSLLWISAGAAVLLLPAVLWGRPFVFYDTPAYWGWGRDIVEALAKRPCCRTRVSPG